MKWLHGITRCGSGSIYEDLALSSIQGVQRWMQLTASGRLECGSHTNERIPYIWCLSIEEQWVVHQEKGLQLRLTSTTCGPLTIFGFQKTVIYQTHPHRMQCGHLALLTQWWWH